jgi:hypothetical protein
MVRVLSRTFRTMYYIHIWKNFDYTNRKYYEKTARRNYEQQTALEALQYQKTDWKNQEEPEYIPMRSRSEQLKSKYCFRVLSKSIILIS